MRSRCFLRRFAQLLLLSVLAGVVGCGYGKVSPKTYELAKALHSMCQREDRERLPVVGQLIDDSEKADDISEQEADWLRDILRRAEGGDWKTAARLSRRIMEDQVDR